MEIIGTLLLPDGTLAEGRLVTDGPFIASVEAHRASQPTGTVLVPGAVDLHGDGFEHWLMPRPGVDLPTRQALLAADRAMLAGGITSAFLSFTLGWAPGLRGIAMAEAILESEAPLAGRRLVQTRHHLRYETGALAYAARVADWLDAGRIGLVSINEHVLAAIDKAEEPARFDEAARKAGQTTEAYVLVLAALAEQRDDMDQTAVRLLRVAEAAGVPAAWHDEQTAADRQRHRDSGARIADFPSGSSAIAEAAAAGDPVILGAPNVVRGGTHMKGKGLSAAAAVACGEAGVLASDYAYSALAPAAAALWRDHAVDFGAAWDTVSGAPARAVGLQDRGMLAAGMRADVVALDLSDPYLPVVTDVWVAAKHVLGRR